MEWALVGAMSGAWVLTFGLFLLVMKKEYRRTFIGTLTGGQQTTERFILAVDDSVTALVMEKNKKLWRAIRDDVKEWVREGWWRWEADRPEWFTESWIAKVPADMIPSEAKKAAQGICASARRRSSFAIVAKESKSVPYSVIFS